MFAAGHGDASDSKRWREREKCNQWKGSLKLMHEIGMREGSAGRESQRESVRERIVAREVRRGNQEKGKGKREERERDERWMERA